MRCTSFNDDPSQLAPARVAFKEWCYQRLQGMTSAEKYFNTSRIFLSNVLKNSIYVTKYALNLQVFYAPHPGRFPGEHSSNAVGHTNGLPKVARLTTVTTVLENLRKFSNYTLQVSIFITYKSHMPRLFYLSNESCICFLITLTYLF